MMNVRTYSRLRDLQAMNMLSCVPLSDEETTEMVYLQLIERLMLPHSFTYNDWLAD